jgi:hypothetical protein
MVHQHLQAVTRVVRMVHQHLQAVTRVVRMVHQHLYQSQLVDQEEVEVHASPTLVKTEELVERLDKVDTCVHVLEDLEATDVMKHHQEEVRVSLTLARMEERVERLDKDSCVPARLGSVETNVARKQKTMPAVLVHARMEAHVPLLDKVVDISVHVLLGSVDSTVISPRDLTGILVSVNPV